MIGAAHAHDPGPVERRQQRATDAESLLRDFIVESGLPADARHAATNRLGECRQLFAHGGIDQGGSGLGVFSHSRSILGRAHRVIAAHYPAGGSLARRRAGRPAGTVAGRRVGQTFAANHGRPRTRRE